MSRSGGARSSGPGADEAAAGGRDPVGEDLADWGKVLVIETTGRSSGRAARAAIGFVEETDGSLLVSAGSPDADWARNLLVDPTCRVDRAGTTVECVAQPLAGAAHHRAVAGLLLRYGTPAERLGSGPSFRLVCSPPSPPPGPGTSVGRGKA